MTREQKPESAGFRTQETHIADLAFHLHEGTCDVCWSVAREMARRFTVESEARGAAERETQDIEEAKDEGANYVLTSLALLFGKDGFEIRDGSETWEGDVNATLEGILKAGGLIDEEGDLLDLATLKDRLAEKRQKDVEGVEPFIIVDALYKPGVSALYSHTANAAEAEKQEPFGYFPKRLVGRNWSGATIKRECSPQSEPKIPLYTRPANFAALEDRVKELKAVAEAALAWIDAVPAEVRESLPAMPGFDRDWADETIAGEME